MRRSLLPLRSVVCRRSEDASCAGGRLLERLVPTGLPALSSVGLVSLPEPCEHVGRRLELASLDLAVA